MYLNKQRISVVKEIKFLGIVFDSKLKFKAHILYLRNKCLKSLNLKIIAHKDWGADQNTLLTLYRTLIHSKLDYVSFIYGSTRKYYLYQLNTIANQALRICTGAFRTSPISSLQIISSEPPLHLRRKELAMKYIIKLQANPSNPTHDTIFRHQPSPLFNTKRKAIPPLSIRIHTYIHTYN